MPGLKVLVGSSCDGGAGLGHAGWMFGAKKENDKGVTGQVYH
jgi:hypothetical protein